MENNGKGDYCNLFGKEKVKYPVKFGLKVFMDNNISEKENQEKIKQVLEKNNIPYSGWSSKVSSKNTYISLTVNVTIDNQKILEDLYKDLREIPEVKYAV